MTAHEVGTQVGYLTWRYFKIIPWQSSSNVYHFPVLAHRWSPPWFAVCGPNQLLVGGWPQIPSPVRPREPKAEAATTPPPSSSLACATAPVLRRTTCPLSELALVPDNPSAARELHVLVICQPRASLQIDAARSTRDWSGTDNPAVISAAVTLEPAASLNRLRGLWTKMV